MKKPDQKQPPNLNEQLMLRTSVEQKTKLEEIARAEGMNLSTCARKAFALYIAEFEKKKSA